MIISFLGALVLTFFLSRALLLVIRRLEMNITIISAIHLASLALALLLPALRSGMPSLGFIYPVGQAIWFVIDIVRLNGEAR